MTTHRHEHMKAALYARAGVTEYWLVDLPGRTVAVHRGLTADGYDEIVERRDGDRITPLLGRPEIDVSELLG